LLTTRRSLGSFVWQVLWAAGLFCAEQARDAEIAEKRRLEFGRIAAAGAGRGSVNLVSRRSLRLWLPLRKIGQLHAAPTVLGGKGAKNKSLTVQDHKEFDPPAPNDWHHSIVQSGKGRHVVSICAPSLGDLRNRINRLRISLNL
jgi:hypothetical protein